jgi:hypothetical protein
MIRVSALADRFMVPGLRHQMECILSQYLTITYAYYEVVAYAYELLPADSMILKAMIYSHCYFCHTGSETNNHGELNNLSKLPREFLLGVMLRYEQLKQDDAVDELRLSDFHEHSCEEDTSACELAWESLDDDLNK